MMNTACLHAIAVAELKMPLFQPGRAIKPLLRLFTGFARTGHADLHVDAAGRHYYRARWRKCWSPADDEKAPARRLRVGAGGKPRRLQMPLSSGSYALFHESRRGAQAAPPRGAVLAPH